MKQCLSEFRDRLTLSVSEEASDWERELQEELQEYDVLDDTESRDDKWDQEIEAMLKEDS